MGPSTKPATSNAAWVPRLAPTRSGSRVMTRRRTAGPTVPEPNPSSSRAPTQAHSSSATTMPSIPTAAAATPARSMRAVWPRSAYRASTTWLVKPVANPAKAMSPTSASLKPKRSRMSASRVKMLP